MKTIRIITISLLAFVAWACNDDFLDIDSKTQIPDTQIWKEGSAAEAYMFDVYFTFQDAGFSEETQSSAVDETLFTHGGRGFKESNEGAYNEANLGWFAKTQSGHQWKRLYANIRSCNDFIANIDKAPFEATFKGRSQLKGEAYFLRAYFYHRLTRGFGGVPLQLRLTKLGEADYTIARSTYTECIDQVLADIDSASVALKDRTFANTQKGRATLAACMALKTRVLTDLASDLHDQGTATKKSGLLAAYPNKDLLFYSKGTRKERWTAVKTAAKSLMDNPMGHELSDYGGSGLSLEDKAIAIQKFFLKDSKEAIFSRYFISTKDESGTKMARFNGPCGYHAWGGNTPIQEFVDGFAMADGTAFDWNNTAHKAAPYKNREARFYASIMYDGMQWRERQPDMASIDPAGIIQTGYYQKDPAKADRSDFWHGLDTRSGEGEKWNGTRTGYYLKKFIDGEIDPQAQRAEVPFPFIRFTEVVMNYIEACIELGELGEARSYLNILRNRVNLPNVSESATKDELRTIYQNERRLELSFEEQRYWDIRRWMIADKQAGIIGLHGIDIDGKLRPGIPKQNQYRHDETKYKYTYTVTDLSGEEKRQWKDKSYFIPIHRDELNRNKKLIQNPGYTE